MLFSNNRNESLTLDGMRKARLEEHRKRSIERSAKYLVIGLESMTPEIWNEMTRVEKTKWRKVILKQVDSYIRCNLCKFPTTNGPAGCESCKYRKEKGIPLKIVV